MDVVACFTYKFVDVIGGRAASLSNPVLVAALVLATPFAC